MTELALDKLTDEEVAVAAAVSPHAAFDVLFARYRGPVYGFISRQIRDVQRIEDLFQNTFLKAFRALTSFRRDAKFKTWLFTIASHVIIDDHRRDGRRESPMALEEEMSPAAPEVAPNYDRDEAAALLKDALDLLSPDHRQLFLLVRFHDMKIAEAAAAVGISPTTAKVTLFRIQQKLGRALSPRLNATRVL